MKTISAPSQPMGSRGRTFRSAVIQRSGQVHYLHGAGQFLGLPTMGPGPPIDDIRIFSLIMLAFAIVALVRAAR
jgi:hypothetical protein